MAGERHRAQGRSLPATENARSDGGVNEVPAPGRGSPGGGTAAYENGKRRAFFGGDSAPCKAPPRTSEAVPHAILRETLI